MIKGIFNKASLLIGCVIFATSLVSCSSNTSDKIGAKLPHKCDKEFEDVDLVEYSQLSVDDSIATYLMSKSESYQNSCKVILPSSKLSEKINAMFGFLSEETYVLFGCRSGNALEVFAQPIFVLGHYDENSAYCLLDSQPFGLQAYHILFEIKSSDFSDLTLVSMSRSRP